MSWDAIAAIGQAVSALALVIVLVQIRNAREEAQRSVGQARLFGSRDLFLVTATHPELASALTRLRDASGSAPVAFEDFATSLGLSNVEARQVSAFQSALWQNFQASIESAGRLTPGVRAELHNRLRYNYQQNRAFAKWWEISKPSLNPNAVRYVDAVLAGTVG